MWIREIRLDVGDRDVDDVLKIIKDWHLANITNIPKIAIAFEIAKETKKPHFQGVLETSYIPKRFSECLSAFKSWAPGAKAFAVVRKPESYVKYIKKDGDIRYFYGYTERDIEDWGDWVTITKKQKDITRREKFYQGFVDLCRNQNDWEMGRYKLRWVAEKLFDYVGKQTLPEQLPWLRGVVFSTQCVLIGTVDGKLSSKARDEWVERLLN